MSDAVVFHVEATVLRGVIEVELEDFPDFLLELEHGRCGAWDGSERCTRRCASVRRQSDLTIAMHAHTLWYVVDAQECVIPVCERHETAGDEDIDPVIHAYIDGRIAEYRMDHIAERARWN